MSASTKLDLHLEEPGDDPICDQVFEILRNTLQPNSELAIETAVHQIVALVPEGKLYSREVGAFLETCYEVADQIPYSHASMTKLVSLIYACLDSIWQAQPPEKREEAGNTPYQKMVETLRDWWNSSSPAEDPMKYVNFQAFTAHLYQRGMIKGSHLAVWTLHDALDSKRVVIERDRNAYIKAASNWLLLYGDAVHAEVAGDKATSKEWKDWSDRLHEVGDGKWNRKPCAYDDDSVALASRAAVAMEAMDRKKAN